MSPDMVDIGLGGLALSGILVAVALTFYFGFILMSVLRS